MKTPEQRQNDMIEAAKKYAKQYEGLMYTIGSIAGIAGIQKAFERGVQFGLHQALDITVEREKAERDAEQQWISVKEQLPEEGEEVLIFGQYLNDIPKVLGVRCRYKGDQKWKYTWEGQDEWVYSQDDVSHWMPLPEPPKDAKE